jgi:retron-type reverse transcriptase
VDLDIKSFFDSIDWELLLRAVRKHAPNRWVVIYIERWLKAPAMGEDGILVLREQGTPHLPTRPLILNRLEFPVRTQRSSRRARSHRR